MQNDGFEYDFESLRNVIDKDKAREIWAKAEIAKIMMEHATRLLSEIRTDIDFYSMVGKIDD